MGLYGETQLHFRAVLDLLFPGYDKAFHKVCNRTALELLSRFPTPAEFLAAEHEEMITLLLSNHRGRAWNESKLQQLIEIASHSLPDLHAVQAQRVVLMQYIHLLKTYQDCMNDLFQTMQSLAESIKIYHLLRTIPGVGLLTAAMLIAEFPSVKQLAAFAGLDSAVHESGTFKSKKNRISKRGSRYLRMTLYQAPSQLSPSKFTAQEIRFSFNFFSKNETKANRQKSQLWQLLTSFYALFLVCGTRVKLFKLVKCQNW